MGSSGNHGGRVLLPFSPLKLHIPEELAGRIGAAAGGLGPTALLVGPSGGKVWRVEVARDGGGAFLGRGWPEFAAAHGLGGAGWFLVLRHHGGGVLTVKAFDTSGRLKEFGGAPAAVEATKSGNAYSHQPQFISLLQPDYFKENMPIPASFVQRYIPKEHLNNQIAVVLSPLGKFWHVGLEVNRSCVTLAGGWSEFLSFHGINEDNALLLKYKSNMVFTVKVFGPDGCQIQYKHKDARIQQTPTLPDIGKKQESQSTSGKKRKSKVKRSSSEGLKRPKDIQKHQESPCSSSMKSGRKNDSSSGEGQKWPKGSKSSLNKASLHTRCVYKIGPPSWIKKEINTSTIENSLSLAPAFCDAIGFQEPCTITLKSSTNSTKSWQVCGFPYKNSSHKLGSGWKRFCNDNKLKKGDICTFNIIKAMLWHVDISRCTQKQQEAPSVSRKCKRKNDMPSCEVRKRPKGSMTLNKGTSSTKSVYKIGPPSWIKKEININALQNHLSLAPTFCNAIGLREPCTITLKTSMDSTKSWQVCGLPFKNSSWYIGLGWKKFCQENRLKVGDICTFNVIKTALWHVVITR